MIGRGKKRGSSGEEDTTPQGFDAFELRLGDVMRGERATMGKSLLDVQRELKIKAAYISAIENCDPDSFDTPGFIAGYVRSYARYLNLDPEWAFETFCAESGFATAHGMSAEASTRELDAPIAAVSSNELFSNSAIPFTPSREPVLAQVEPRAVGSILVLIALIGGLGYGGYTVLNEVQKVSFAPVEQTPTVVSNIDIDPLSRGASTDGTQAPVMASSEFTAPSAEALDRLYRPQALDVPVMVARDAPISTLDPRNSATFYEVARSELTIGEGDVEAFEQIASIATGEGQADVIRVTEGPLPEVALVAVRPAWVRVRAADGTVIFEATMNKGDTYIVPQTEEPATLRIGESGAMYFAVNGTAYGPVGTRGQVTSNVSLSADNLTASYSQADLSADQDLQDFVQTAELTFNQ